jgi:hypothetical protein
VQSALAAYETNLKTMSAVETASSEKVTASAQALLAKVMMNASPVFVLAWLD